MALAGRGGIWPHSTARKGGLWTKGSLQRSARAMSNANGAGRALCQFHRCQSPPFTPATGLSPQPGRAGIDLAPCFVQGEGIGRGMQDGGVLIGSNEIDGQNPAAGA